MKEGEGQWKIRTSGEGREGERERGREKVKKTLSEA